MYYIEDATERTCVPRPVARTWLIRLTRKILRRGKLLEIAVESTVSGALS